MIERIAVIALAALAFVSSASAQDDRNSYYWSNGQRNPVALAPDLVAVRFSIEPDAQLIASIGRDNNLDWRGGELYAPLRPHRIEIYAVRGVAITNRYLADLQSRLTQPGSSVADVGRLLTTPNGTLAMLTDRLSIGFVDGVSGLADLRGLPVEPLVSIVRTLNARPLVVSYRVNPDSGQTALEIANSVHEYRDGSGRQLVTYAVPTLRFPRELRGSPNDDLYTFQWHLNADAPSRMSTRPRPGTTRAARPRCSPAHSAT